MNGRPDLRPRLDSQEPLRYQTGDVRPARTPFDRMSAPAGPARSGTTAWHLLLLFAVSAEGKIVYGGQDVGVSGVQPLVKRMTSKDEDMPVIIQVDEKAPSGIFVRVIDEAKLGGAKKVSVATEK